MRANLTKRKYTNITIYGKNMHELVAEGTVDQVNMALNVPYATLGGRNVHLKDVIAALTNAGLKPVFPRTFAISLDSDKEFTRGEPSATEPVCLLTVYGDDKANIIVENPVHEGTVGLINRTVEAHWAEKDYYIIEAVLKALKSNGYTAYLSPHNAADIEDNVPEEE